MSTMTHDGINLNLLGRPANLNPDICQSCGANWHELRKSLYHPGTEDYDIARIIIENCPTCKAHLGGNNRTKGGTASKQVIPGSSNFQSFYHSKREGVAAWRVYPLSN